jgi:hypothetical protein
MPSHYPLIRHNLRGTLRGLTLEGHTRLGNSKWTVWLEDSDGTSFIGRTQPNAGFTAALSAGREGRVYDIVWHRTSRGAQIIADMREVKAQ